MSTATQSAVAEIEALIGVTAMPETDQRAVYRVAKQIEAMREAHGGAVKIAVMLLALRYAHEAD